MSFIKINLKMAKTACVIALLVVFRGTVLQICTIWLMKHIIRLWSKWMCELLWLCESIWGSMCDTRWFFQRVGGVDESLELRGSLVRDVWKEDIFTETHTPFIYCCHLGQTHTHSERNGTIIERDCVEELRDLLNCLSVR